MNASEPDASVDIAQSRRPGWTRGVARQAAQLGPSSACNSLMSRTVRAAIAGQVWMPWSKTTIPGNIEPCPCPLARKCPYFCPCDAGARLGQDVVENQMGLVAVRAERRLEFGSQTRDLRIYCQKFEGTAAPNCSTIYSAMRARSRSAARDSL